MRILRANRKQASLSVIRLKWNGIQASDIQARWSAIQANRSADFLVWSPGLQFALTLSLHLPSVCSQHSVVCVLHWPVDRLTG